MTKSIMIAGVGGQGTLLASKTKQEEAEKETPDLVIRKGRCFLTAAFGLLF